MTTTIDDVIIYLIWADWGLSVDEMEEIIEHRAVFQKYIDVAIATNRINLANMAMQGKEWSAYMAIEVFTQLKNDMENSVENFKRMIQAKKQKEAEENSLANE